MNYYIPQTILWLAKDFKFKSQLKGYSYLFKRKFKIGDPSKTFLVEFKFSDEKLKFKLRSNDDFFILRDIFLFESYKLPKFKDDVNEILDCGSHLGSSAVYFKIKYPRAKIICFEPDEESREILKFNLRLNEVNCKVFDCAVSGKDGLMKFKSSKRDSASSKLDEFGEVEVEVKSLENAIRLAGVEKVDVLKLDIEGEEISAIKSLDKNLKKVGCIICENHYEMYDEKVLFKILEKKGFAILEPLPHLKKISKETKYPIIVAEKNEKA